MVGRCGLVSYTEYRHNRTHQLVDSHSDRSTYSLGSRRGALHTHTQVVTQYYHCNYYCNELITLRVYVLPSF